MANDPKKHTHKPDEAAEQAKTEQQKLGPGQDIPPPATPQATGDKNLQPGTPNSSRAPTTVGTGAAPQATTDVDPNIDIAREQAKNTFARKEAAGEDPGQPPPEPVSLASQQATEPSGPVAKGMKRVRVKSPVSSGGRMYDVGRIVDLAEDEATSLGDSVEEV